LVPGLVLTAVQLWEQEPVEWAAELAQEKAVQLVG
jgi:hypothetical protein